MLRVNGRWSPRRRQNFFGASRGFQTQWSSSASNPAIELDCSRQTDRNGMSPTLRSWGLAPPNVPSISMSRPIESILLNHSGAEVVFVAGETQVRRLLESRGRLTWIKHIICAAAPPDLGDDILRYENSPLRRVTPLWPNIVFGPQRWLRTSWPRSFIRPVHGRAQGRHAHAQHLSSNEETSAEAFQMTPADTAVSFLPLSHVYERVTAYAYLFHGFPSHTSSAWTTCRKP